MSIKNFKYTYLDFYDLFQAPDFIHEEKVIEIRLFNTSVVKISDNEYIYGCRVTGFKINTGEQITYVDHQDNMVIVPGNNIHCEPIVPKHCLSRSERNQHTPYNDPHVVTGQNFMWGNWGYLDFIDSHSKYIPFGGMVFILVKNGHKKLLKVKQSNEDYKYIVANFSGDDRLTKKDGLILFHTSALDNIYEVIIERDSNEEIYRIALEIKYPNTKYTDAGASAKNMQILNISFADDSIDILDWFYPNGVLINSIHGIDSERIKKYITYDIGYSLSIDAISPCGKEHSPGFRRKSINKTQLSGYNYIGLPGIVALYLFMRPEMIDKCKDELDVVHDYLLKISEGEGELVSDLEINTLLDKLAPLRESLLLAGDEEYNGNEGVVRMLDNKIKNIQNINVMIINMGYCPLFSFGTPVLDIHHNNRTIQLGVGHIKIPHTHEYVKDSNIQKFKDNLDKDMRNMYGEKYIKHYGTPIRSVCYGYTYMMYFFIVWKNSDGGFEMKISDSFLPHYLGTIPKNGKHDDDYKFSLIFPMGLEIANDTNNVIVTCGEGDFYAIELEFNINEVINLCVHDVRRTDMREYKYKILGYDGRQVFESDRLSSIKEMQQTDTKEMQQPDTLDLDLSGGTYRVYRDLYSINKNNYLNIR
jgi:hypothetical protein